MKRVCDRHSEAYEVDVGCQWCEPSDLTPSFADMLKASMMDALDATHAGFMRHCGLDAKGQPLATPAAHNTWHLMQQALADDDGRVLTMTGTDANGSPVSMLSAQDRRDLVQHWIAAGFMSADMADELLAK